MASSEDILEFLSAIQETLETLSTKVAGIESTLNTKLPRLEAALAASPALSTRPLPTDTDADADAELEQLDLDLVTPIRHDEQDPTKGTTMKASLARIEKKLGEFEPQLAKLPAIEANTSRITQLQLDLARVDGRVRDAHDAVKTLDTAVKSLDTKLDVVAAGVGDLVDAAARKADLAPIQRGVDAAATAAELAGVKTRVEGIDRKVDGAATAADVDARLGDIKAAVARVEGKVASASPGLTSSQAAALGRIETKVDEAKVRDLAIYQNNVLRSINGKLPKTAETHMVLKDVHTGHSIYGNHRSIVDKYPASEIDSQLRRLGADCSVEQNGEGTARSVYWGYIRDDASWHW